MDTFNSKLDANQVLRQAFDDSTQSLRTTSSGSGGDTTVVQPDGTLLHATIDSTALAPNAATESSLSYLATKSAASLVSEPYDFQSISYVASGNGVGEIQTVVYKLGGSSGTLVATLTLAYDAQNRLTSVTRS